PAHERHKQLSPQWYYNTAKIFLHPLPCPERIKHGDRVCCFYARQREELGYQQHEFGRFEAQSLSPCFSVSGEQSGESHEQGKALWGALRFGNREKAQEDIAELINLASTKSRKQPILEAW
ncbi:MAG: hypothetical protein N2491_13955, partial [Negativicutes bacterium]|nr:hypothetical protein [Negativicutes bacterium]